MTYEDIMESLNEYDLLDIVAACYASDESLEEYNYNGCRITNYEMESAMLQGLAKMMGHHAMTVCCIIANRMKKDASSNYKSGVEEIVKTVLARL